MASNPSPLSCFQGPHHKPLNIPYKGIDLVRRECEYFSWWEPFPERTDTTLIKGYGIRHFSTKCSTT